MELKGKVWRYGDNIDTDVIIPARYLNSFDPAELASHCMVDIDETFSRKVQKGDIMVGGKNFGCGSSREHAPIAIKASGVPVIIAASFARIFYRNGINIGLPLLEIGDAVEKIKADDVLRVDTSAGRPRGSRMAFSSGVGAPAEAMSELEKKLVERAYCP